MRDCTLGSLNEKYVPKSAVHGVNVASNTVLLCCSMNMLLMNVVQDSLFPSLLRCTPAIGMHQQKSL